MHVRERVCALSAVVEERMSGRARGCDILSRCISQSKPLESSCCTWIIARSTHPSVMMPLLCLLLAGGRESVCCMAARGTVVERSIPEFHWSRGAWLAIASPGMICAEKYARGQIRGCGI
jgi:hypothetical protein